MYNKTCSQMHYKPVVVYHKYSQGKQFVRNAFARKAFVKKAFVRKAYERKAFARKTFGGKHNFKRSLIYHKMKP